MDYGFGAVFGCPAHDQRDFDFAKKYNLEIKSVVKPIDQNDNFSVQNEAYSGPGILINSEFLNGLKVPNESINQTIKFLEEKKLGKRKTNYRLKDWGISRQRYWGCPIPIAYDEDDNIINNNNTNEETFQNDTLESLKSEIEVEVKENKSNNKLIYIAAAAVIILLIYFNS